MIVNPLSATALTLDLLSTGLAAVTAVKTAALLFGRENRESSPERIAGREDRLYLVFWMGAVLLIIRLALWPFFYVVLQSFVPEVEGTMCIFGVRNLLPRLARTLELIKPLLFFLGLVWLLLFRLERFGRSARDGRSMPVLLLVCALIGLAEAGGSVVFWLRSSADLAVSCCTTITDIPTRFTVWVPLALFGPQFDPPLWFGYFGMNLLVIISAMWVRQRLRPETAAHSLLWGVALAALINGVVSTLAFIEVIAPRLMEMPFHHCIYCFAATVADAPLILGLFILGSFLLMAAWPLSVLAAPWALASERDRLRRSLLQYGALFLAGSCFMVAVHLVAGGAL